MNVINHVNRLIMIVLALLLTAAPVAILLIILGVIPDSVLQDAVGSLGGIPDAVTAAGAAVGVAGVVLAIIALVLLLLELRVKLTGRVNHLYLQRDGIRNTRLAAKGAASLVEGAATDAGALSPKASVKPYKKSYRFSCRISAPATADLAGFAAGVRRNIHEVLEYQQIPAKSVQVILQGVQEADENTRTRGSGRGEAGRRSENGTSAPEEQASDHDTATAAK